MPPADHAENGRHFAMPSRSASSSSWSASKSSKCSMASSGGSPSRATRGLGVNSGIPGRPRPVPSRSRRSVPGCRRGRCRAGVVGVLRTLGRPSLRRLLTEVSKCSFRPLVPLIPPLTFIDFISFEVENQSTSLTPVYYSVSINEVIDCCRVWTGRVEHHEQAPNTPQGTPENQ